MAADKKTKIGAICFANDSGLGAQTRRLARLINPDIIMVIDSSRFSRNKRQHFEWYQDYPYFVVNGLPNNVDVKHFLQNLTHVFCCENPYNFGLVYWGQKQGTKIYCQSNYEFCENLSSPWLPVPDKFLMPSHWMIGDMIERFGADRVEYLPPATDPVEFAEAREINLARRGKRRFLHLIGTAAAEDRNGTFDLLEVIKLTKGDFEVVIRSQHPLSMDVYLDDPRVKYEVDNWETNQDLYKDFDALLLPRRWGGLCLPMHEALFSGLPVLMTSITPNKEVLPSRWLAPSNRMGEFHSRVATIPYYSVGHGIYAELIEQFATMTDEVLVSEKKTAFEIANKNFSFDALRPKYSALFDDGQS